eukprot:TRINITY_DN122338_c0_g1_i1.p1 TRINITY_DN122338_c0_g1~~TRINITY_DN122338_c0_g1_i1.p1  ORF type:complete len:465 (+),score=66.04 TRINITY_DN122338_c0_g1_i1:171-1565(+)
MPRGGSSPQPTPRVRRTGWHAATFYTAPAAEASWHQRLSNSVSFSKWFTCCNDDRKGEPDEETPLIDSDSGTESRGGRMTLNFSLFRLPTSDVRAHADDFIISHVNCREFEVGLLVVVLLNALAIGLQIDHEHLASTSHWLMLDCFFNLVYTLEICLKIYVFGCGPFFQVPYNLFGSIVTLLGWSVMRGPLWLTELTQILQLMRLWKLGVVFPEIGLLLDSFLMSTTSISWVVVLGLLLFFISACVTTAFIGHRDFITEEMKWLASRFDTIPHSMFSLFEITTLEGWMDYVRPLLVRHPFAVLAFLAFIFLANFFLLNLITAVVVENMLKAKDKEELLQEKVATQAQDQNLRRLVLHVRDLNEGSVVVPSDKLKKWMKSDPDLKECLQNLGWTEAYFISIVDLCDGEEGEVQLSALTTALQDMRGELSTGNYVKFQQQVHRKVELVDHLCQLMLQMAAATIPES